MKWKGERGNGRESTSGRVPAVNIGIKGLGTEEGVYALVIPPS